MNCCDDYIGECKQGHSCPVRETPVEQLVRPVLDLPAPKYCERTKQNCNTPWTCSSQCRVTDSQLPVQMFEPPRWYQMPGAMTAFFTIACALIGFAAAVYQTF